MRVSSPLYYGRCVAVIIQTEQDITTQGQVTYAHIYTNSSIIFVNVLVLNGAITSAYCWFPGCSSKFVCYWPLRFHEIPRHYERVNLSATAWWRHQMETFSPLLSPCEGNQTVTGEIHSQRPVTRSFDVFFDLRLDKRNRKQLKRLWFQTQSHSLWRRCNGRI